MHAIRASARYSRAIHAIAELLEKLKIDSMFVGGAARSAWLDVEMDSGAIDVLALHGGAAAEPVGHDGQQSRLPRRAGWRSSRPRSSTSCR